ncbi:MAG: 50S ribosomal protein L4 [Leptospirales bacterium]
MDIQVLSQNGSKVNSIKIPVSTEDLESINIPLLHEIVQMQRAGIRSGTASTKTRGEVSGGGRKPYRQKGTGRARQGSIRAPQWRGGAIIFGPRPRDYSYRQPSKKVVLAIKNAILTHLKTDSLQVVENLDVSSRKTKDAILQLKKWNLSAGQERLLLIDLSLSEEMYYACRNVPGLEILMPHQINPYDLIVADKVVVSQAAFSQVTKFFEGAESGPV